MVRLRRIEAGVYATPDRRYQIERVGSVGEWDSYTDRWVIQRYTSPEAADNFNGTEIFEAGTKRDCVAQLERILQADTNG